MSGGTRCNITHATDNRGIVDAYEGSPVGDSPGSNSGSLASCLSVQDTIDLFEAEGVATKVEDTGKVFPVSNRARATSWMRCCGGCHEAEGSSPWRSRSAI